MCSTTGSNNPKLNGFLVTWPLRWWRRDTVTGPRLPLYSTHRAPVVAHIIYNMSNIAPRSFHNFGRQRSLSSSPKDYKDAKLLIRKFRYGPKSRKKGLHQLSTNDLHHISTSDPVPGGNKPLKVKPKPPQRNDRDAADATAIPNPIPDTGIHVKPPWIVGHSISSPGNAVGDAGITTSLNTVPFSFTPLPPLLSAVSTSASFVYTTSTTAPRSSVTASATPYIPSTANQPQYHQSHHISMAVIILLAIGSAFGLVGIFIFIRFCRRPHKRLHPTPSLPILDDEFKDNRFAEDGSPIFGGKERFSARPASEGTWALYQYQPSIAKPVAAAASQGRMAGDESRGYGAEKALQEKAYYDGYKQKTRHMGIDTTNVQQPSAQQAPAPPTHVKSRLSAASVSLYPNSPLDAHNIGIAMDGELPLDVDQVIKHATSTTNVQRHRKVIRNSGEQNALNYSQGFAYSGADVTSPKPPTSQSVPIIKTTPSAVNGGRSRIKSTYFGSNANIRTSAGLASSSTLKSSPSPFEELQYNPTISESRRDRDTKALTFALGLDTPSIPPPSPQPTLYPDDSLSDSGDAMRHPAPKRAHKKLPKVSTNRSLVTATTETSASLGNLMLMDFGTTGSLAYLKDPSVSSSSLVPKKNTRGEDSDDPPRVPSPPPMPSLSQMGLAHANPEAFADYRSPTYSIYNLYGPGKDRKSKISVG
jgi:hypothetical protein